MYAGSKVETYVVSLQRSEIGIFGVNVEVFLSSDYDIGASIADGCLFHLMRFLSMKDLVSVINEPIQPIDKITERG